MCKCGSAELPVLPTRPNNLADAYLVADLDLHGAGTHMRVQNVTVLRDFDDDMIARRIVEIYRNHILAGMGDVLRHAV
jgi:hypothetical protein